MHLALGNFRVVFVTANAALLTQGKDNKAKSTEKGQCRAARGSAPITLRFALSEPLQYG